MNSISKKRLMASAIAVSALIVPAMASAQQATVPAEPAVTAADATNASAGGLGDIVVTANKREQLARRTPVAIDAFDQKTLAANGVTDLRALQNVSPTLQIGMSGTNTLLTIRGISSRDFTEIGDPAVAVSIDNFYLQRAAALNAGVFDVERIEVLRGPQGTLYGRNATAGAINISSVKPSLNGTEGFGSIEYGNYNTVRAEGAFNLPLSDTLAVRASFLSSRHDGYSNTSGVPRDGDDDDTQAARVHLLWKPINHLSVLLTGEYTHVGGVGPVAYGQPYRYTSTGAIDHSDVPVTDSHNWSLNTPGSLDITTKSVRTQISYDLGFASIAYFGGYRNFKYARVNDTDGTALSTSGGYLTFPQNEDEDTQNHEIRITSSGDTRFTWQGGLYYFKERNTLLSFFGTANTVPPVYSRTFSYNVGAESKAAFAQVGYKILDKLQIEGGIRYSDDNKFRVGYNIVSGVQTNQNSRTSGDKVTWHVGLNSQITPSNLLYAKVDTGYKSGGFTDLNDYGPESITSYEVGSKNRFFDNVLEANLSAFYYDYTDLQVSQYRADGRTQIVNAGKAEIYGLELETVLKATPNDRLNLSANYLHGRYTDFAIAVGGVNVSYSGNPMIQSPDWSLSGGYEHVFNILSGALTARAQSHYQTRSFFSYRNFDSESQRAFTKTDLTLNYQPDGQEWSLLLYLRNLENKRVITDVSEYGSSRVYRFQFAEPLTAGGRITYRF